MCIYIHWYVNLCLCLCLWPAGAHSITLVLEALSSQWKWPCKHWIRSMCQGTVCRWGRRGENAERQGLVGVTIPYWAEFISIQGQRHLAPWVMLEYVGLTKFILGSDWNFIESIQYMIYWVFEFILSNILLHWYLCNCYVLTSSISVWSFLVYSSFPCCSWFCTGAFHSYSCHTFAPVSLLYSHNITFPHFTKSTAAGSSQIEFPSRSVEGQELLFLITNASGDVVTYQLKEQLGHQVAPLCQTTSPKTQNTRCQSTRQAYSQYHYSVFFFSNIYIQYMGGTVV